MRKTVQPIAWPVSFLEARAEARETLAEHNALVQRVMIHAGANAMLRKLLDVVDLPSVPVQQIARWATDCEDVGVTSDPSVEVDVLLSSELPDVETVNFELPEDAGQITIRLVGHA